MLDLTPACLDGSNPNYTDNPVKIVIYVPDTAATIEKIRAAGYEIVREPEPLEKLNIAALAFAKDPDGYLVELIQKPPKQ